MIKYNKGSENMEHNLKSSIEFYIMATKIKNKLRSGWNDEHWNISCKRRESVAEHVYGTCILAISLYPYYDTKINLDKVLKMLIIHELSENLIQDFTPAENISKEEKLKYLWQNSFLVFLLLVLYLFGIYNESYVNVALLQNFLQYF